MSGWFGSYLPLSPKHVKLLLPHIWVFLHESLADLGVIVGKESLPPQPKGSGIMATDICDRFDNESAIGFRGDMVQ